MRQAPPPEAPFADKMAYYRTQHTSRGSGDSSRRHADHRGRPAPDVRQAKVGAAMFIGGWAIQILGHRLFEKNLPSTHKGWITYQLTGVIHVCEQYGEMLARRSQRKAALR